MSARTWRIIAQRILTGEFLSYEVPLGDASRTRELSGPGGIQGTIEPELRHVKGDDGRPLIEEWSTALYYEEDGLIRSGGIVQRVTASGSQLIVDAPGFSSYATGMPITKDYTPLDFEDPLVTYQKLWAHLQNYPDGDLGLTVTHPGSYYLLSGGSGPYKVGQWENRDYGQDLDSIAQAVPFDYVESHSWNSNHTAIAHRINLGFPRLGRRRDDLRFAQGENISSFDTIGADGTRYSNEVHMLGSGEGIDMPKAVAAVRDGRLRRPVAVSKKFYTQNQANLGAARELRSRELKLDIPAVVVADHKNAPIASIVPGDDILVEVDVQWFGHLRIWLRVLSVEESITNPGKATLRTQRSDYFIYASENNPNPDKEPIVITL